MVGRRRRGGEGAKEGGRVARHLGSITSSVAALIRAGEESDVTCIWTVKLELELEGEEGKGRDKIWSGKRIEKCDRRASSRASALSVIISQSVGVRGGMTLVGVEEWWVRSNDVKRTGNVDR